MRRYLCLGYYDPDAFERLGEGERAALGPACAPHDRALRGSGRLRAVASLEHRTAVSVRPGADGPTVTDGPFTEAREMVGSFWIVEAEDLADAVRVASLHPAARLGGELGWGVEVRPIELEEGPQV